MKKFLNLLLFFVILVYETISICFCYNLFRLTGIEDLIRYIAIGVILLFDIIIWIIFSRLNKKEKNGIKIFFIILLVIFGIIEFFAGYTINKGLQTVSSISTKKERIYSTSLISYKDGNISSVSDIKSSTKIGRINDKDDIEGYVLTSNIIKKDNILDSQIVSYDDAISMLADLYDGSIDCAFVSSSYSNKYVSIDKFSDIANDVIELDKFSKKMEIVKNKTNTATTKPIKEPFSILLMGVDSTEEDLTDSSGLGDSLILITFNPNTLNATILSIPRDTYVRVTCYGNKFSKITHAASGGDSCMINTIQKEFSIDIDYYVKINFAGLVKIVDALGGVEVDVPYSFCEQDSKRRWGEYTQYVKKGFHKLNGEQALAFSRNRKTSESCSSEWNKGTRNDFVRGQNQQMVINAIMNKARNMSSLTQFYNLLEAIGNSMTTNLSDSQILSFYNVFKNIIINSSLNDDNDIINMQKLYINGSDARLIDGIARASLYEFVPYQKSLDVIIKAMKVNLEIEKEEVRKDFEFSIDETYEQDTIGKHETGSLIKYDSYGDDNNSNSQSTSKNSSDSKSEKEKNGSSNSGSSKSEKEINSSNSSNSSSSSSSSSSSNSSSSSSSSSNSNNASNSNNSGSSNNSSDSNSSSNTSGSSNSNSESSSSSSTNNENNSSSSSTANSNNSSEENTDKSGNE